MYQRIIATFALSFIFFSAFSQISYHRLYETSLNDPAGMNDTIFFHMQSTTTSGDVYAMGTKRVGDSAGDYEDLSVIFTKHDNKGNIDWSNELDFGNDTISIVEDLSNASFDFNSTQDSILFSIAVEINGERTDLFGRLETDGSQIQLWRVGGLVYSSDHDSPNTAAFINGTDLLNTTAEQPIITRLGGGDSLVWSRAYTFNNSNDDSLLDRILDMETSPDSTIVIAGKSDLVSDDFMVAKLDTNGVQLWAESFNLDVNNVLNVIPASIVPLASGDVAVTGTYITSVPFGSNGFVSIIDTTGTPTLTRKIYVEENLSSIVQMTLGSDGNLWIAGQYAASADTVSHFTTNMSADGTINWTTIYPEQLAGVGAGVTSMLNVESTGGVTLVGHGFIDDLPVMSVMKHDVDGTTPCSDTLTAVIEDLAIISDTLTSDVSNGGIFLDSLEFELMSFSGFTPPILSINQYPPFCPNEPIDTLLIATVSQVAPENVTYMWSTGEFNDTIRVTEEGQYSVTVTISEDVCFTMCDTVELTRLTLPQADININDDRFCDENLMVLELLYQPGATLDSILWSTMETTPSIEVTEEGIYSVTVIDECGEVATAEVNVTFPVTELLLNLIESDNFAAICNDNNPDRGHRLDAVLQGGIGTPTFEWSTGESGSPIYVTEPGTYTVTATDACGDFLEESINIDNIKQVPESGEITFELVCDEDNNALSRIIFNATTNIDNLEDAVVELNVFRVEDSEIVSEATIPSGSLPLDNYIAVLSTCDEDLATITVNATALCGGLIQFPIAFFPGGMDEASSTFGPIPNDTMNVEQLISDIEFKIFNRWGETVFESTELLDAWDGSHKGDPAPSEVYIWYFSYVLEGVARMEKGDVTLIR